MSEQTISGVYELIEWHDNGSIHRPPEVEGRFVVLNGTVSTILHNRIRPDSRITGILLGTYRLDADTFCYGYDDVSMYTESPTGISVSHDPPWTGLRAFVAKIDGSDVRLRTTDGAEEFLFTTAGLTYRENGRSVRRWRRVSSR
jgi:hypothetical protein